MGQSYQILVAVFGDFGSSGRGQCNTIPSPILIMIHIVRWLVKNLLEKAANPEKIQGPNQLSDSLHLVALPTKQS